MYLDVKYDDLIVGDYLIIDCWKVLNPNDATGVFNDPFLRDPDNIDQETVGSEQSSSRCDTWWN